MSKRPFAFFLWKKKNTTYGFKEKIAYLQFYLGLGAGGGSDTLIMKQNSINKPKAITLPGKL